MIDDYEVLQPLGATAIGRTYLVVRKDAPGVPRVLELVDRSFALNGRFMSTLEVEREVALLFRHPVSVRVHEVFVQPRQVYIVYDFVVGVRLPRLLHRLQDADEPMQWDVLLAIGLQLAEALQSAHARPWAPDSPQGLCHGRVRPETIFVTFDGHIRLMGLGMGVGRALLAQPVSVLAYLAPECLRKRRATRAADIYGLGLTLFDAIAGRQSFVGKSKEAVCEAVAVEPLARLGDSQAHVPAEVEDLLFNMCRKLPGQRPVDMAAVLTRMQAYLPESQDTFSQRLADLVAVHCEDTILHVQGLLQSLPGGDVEARAPLSSVAPDAPLQAGALISERYRVLDTLGAGGAAIVYRVEHVGLGRQFALKMLRAEVSRLPSLAERFRREAHAIGSLDHPNIVRVTDFGQTEDGALFTVMHLVDGASLHDILQKLGTLDAVTAIEVACGVLEGLQCAHAAGVVHRDIKPDNIMLATKDGQLEVKLVDFGIAQMDGGDPTQPRITQSNVLLGTPSYMAPEQAAGEVVDHRVDLYAIGVVLYEALTGKRPFEGPNAVSILAKVLTEIPAPFELEAQQGVRAERLVGVVKQALAKDAGDRFQDAQHLREVLQGCRLKAT